MNIKYFIRIMCGFFLIIAAFSLDMFYSDRASGAEKTDIISVGKGSIKNNNTADARKDAISDALRKGIEQYLVSYLGSQGMADNFTKLINDIAPVAGEDIENYQILAEDRSGDIYRILVSVKVNENLMGERLKKIGIVRIETTSIKILFLVSEIASGKERSSWWSKPEGNPALTTTELKLYNIFQKQGMETINRLSNPPALKYSEGMREPDISNDAAMQWGRLFSADLIIKGGCSTTSDNMVAVDLEAIKVEDGVSICRAGSEEKMNSAETLDDGFTKALDRAINNIAVQFGPQIINALGKIDGKSNKIVLTLNDVKNYEEFRMFKKYLEDEIGGIKSVVQSRIKGSSITMSVEFLGTRDAFINKLKGSKKFPVQADKAEKSGGEIVIAIEHEMMDPIAGPNVNIQ